MQERIDAAVARVRSEFAGDVGVLLEEVARVGQRLEVLEGVVREEQKASMTLLETVMASMGHPPPPTSAATLQ